MIGAIARINEFSLQQFVTASVLSSVRKGYYRIFGEYPNNLSRERIWSFIAEAIFTTARTAFKSHASDANKRGYKHDTTDLVRSMGVAVFQGDTVMVLHGGTMTTAEGASGKAVSRFEASKAHSEQIKKRTRNHYIRPSKAFDDTVDNLEEVVKSNKNAISVCFIAAMPYARRLELDYHKRVLLGAMNTIENMFWRNLGIKPQRVFWEYEIGGLSWDEIKAIGQ